MKTTTTKPSTDEEVQNIAERLLTVSDVMQRLQCSESFVRKLFQRKQLVYIKLSHGAVRVRLAHLEAWLAARTITGMERSS